MLQHAAKLWTVQQSSERGSFAVQWHEHCIGPGGRTRDPAQSMKERGFLNSASVLCAQYELNFLRSAAQAMKFIPGYLLIITGFFVFVADGMYYVHMKDWDFLTFADVIDPCGEGVLSLGEIITPRNCGHTISIFGFDAGSSDPNLPLWQKAFRWFYRQPVFIVLILFGAAITGFLYHIDSESAYYYPNRK